MSRLRTSAACLQLFTFSTGLRALRLVGVVSAAQAEAWLADVALIRAVLGCR